MSPPLTPEGTEVAAFLSRIAGDLYTGEGVRVGLADLKVVSAGKKIKMRKEGVDILCAAFVKLEEKYPEVLDALVFALTEPLKEKLRKACGAKPTINVKAEKL